MYELVIQFLQLSFLKPLVFGLECRNFKYGLNSYNCVDFRAITHTLYQQIKLNTNVNVFKFSNCVV